MKIIFASIIFCLFFTSCDEFGSENSEINNSVSEEEEFVHDYTDYEAGDSIVTGRYMNDNSQYGKHIEINEWDDLIRYADRIAVYNWNGNEGNPANTYHFMVRNSRMDKSATLVKELNDNERETWRSLVIDTANYENLTPMCFIPHIAFLYYKDDVVIGQSNVCFLCSAIFSMPGTRKSITPEATVKIKSFCDSLGLKIYDSHDKVTG